MPLTFAERCRKDMEAAHRRILAEIDADLTPEKDSSHSVWDPDQDELSIDSFKVRYPKDKNKNIKLHGGAQKKLTNFWLVLHSSGEESSCPCQTYGFT